MDFDISFGKNRSDTNWKPQYLKWEEFVGKLRKCRRTAETMAEYDAMDKPSQGNAKDGAAFVGGLVRGGRRKKENIDTRSVITLDVDHAVGDFLFDAELVLGGRAYVIYSTHSHRAEKPKYRLLVPMDRAVTPDEYGAVSRKLAEQIGMEQFDKTTFEVQRLMYMPSCSKDAEPVFEEFEGDALDVETMLAEYKDWKDLSQWPKHPKDDKGPALNGVKAQDPREKVGMVGLFCRAFTIEEGIEKLLPHVYENGSMANRYTYTTGNSGNGLEVFPDQDLAYSHQDSDPAANGRTHNLFDLVRIHKFGELDDDVKPGTNDKNRPSEKEMNKFVAEQDEVKTIMIDELGNDDWGLDNDDGKDWKTKLTINADTGKPHASAGNVELILSNAVWGGVLAFDAFGNSEVIRGRLPWRVRERQQADYEPWLGADDKRLQHWLAKKYTIKGGSTIINAFTEVAHSNKFHPIKEYLESFVWDGVKRLDSLFIDYLGAEDTRYVRQVTRKMFLAAVTRLYIPGCKFDEMLVLVGPQGAGKSSLLAKMGRKWFSDSLRTFDNKEAGEHLQNGWIFEIGELSAMKKSEVDEVKAFLSKTEDRYRVAYDRQVSDFPRKCVFFGTTNTSEFLKDDTGNRRFWPVTIEPEKAKLDHWEHLKEELIGQMWAEVLQAYQGGETLILDDATRAEAERKQGDHLEADPREGVIREWLDAPIEKSMTDKSSTVEYRNIVCASMIWAECLHKRIGDMKSWDARIICGIMRNTQGWAEIKGRVHLPEWGKQTGFERTVR